MRTLILVFLILGGCSTKQELPINVDAYCYDKLTALNVSHVDAKRRCAYKGL